MISSKFCIFLTGDLGSGKTTFAQGLAKGLKISEKYYITSPTYSIINEYPGSSFNFYHIDLYRIEKVFELESTGLDEIMDQKNSVIAIEWPEILDKALYNFDLKIEFSLHNDISRKISILASGRKGSNLLEKLLL